MNTDKDTAKPTVTYYGKKVYYMNPLIAKKPTTVQKQPKYMYEDIEEDKDR